MNTATLTRSSLPTSAPAAARTALALLARLKHGSLAVHLPDGALLRFGDGGTPQAAITLHNWNVCRAALKSGDIGFAESYIAGDWSTPDLTELLKLFIRNRKEVEEVIYGSWLGRLLYRVRHLLNRNTRANSQRNIHAHYDIGNAFYELWLDDTMNYSSAWFGENPQASMREAQNAKVRRALRMAGVQPGHRVLEIGCGWGALAEMATTEFGASLTGVTLSTEQLDFARQRMQRLGIPGDAGPPQGASASSGGSAAQELKSVGTRVHADLRLQDYRDISDAPFDAICSIEMVEAVGQAYWPTYFAQVAALLKLGGRACIQSIVIDDALFERYLRSTDFIQQYNFPGGCLPCPREFRAQAEAAGLEVVDELAFGADYAETLRQWRERFLSEKSRVLQLGLDERFVRIWEFYLTYCEAAFAMGNIDVMQFTLQKR
ncbi:MAG: class I SAM-dependent methyltransferase [Ramlibacter sp.]|nr:class I SAM-dependent methyltransferase [Ramlibacter sp.]